MKLKSLAILAFSIAAGSQCQDHKDQVPQSIGIPYLSLNAKAQLAHVEDPSSIDNLTKAVLGYPHAITLPPSVAGLLQTRLSRAESAYRNGLNAGVSEESLLNLINELSNKLKLPDYAQVTPSQLRVLRMQLALQSPAMMATGLATSKMHIGDSVSTIMSPLQAMHVFSVMLDQKILNPDYQDGAIDLQRKLQQQRNDFEESKKARGVGNYQATIVHNSRNLEMRNAVALGVQSLSLKDTVEILDSAFSTAKLDY